MLLNSYSVSIGESMAFNFMIDPFEIDFKPFVYDSI